jgi:hypothetical protein
VPGVVDFYLGRAHHEDEAFAGRRAVAHHPGRARHPGRVADTARERPAAGDAMPARRWHGVSRRHVAAGRERRAPVGHDIAHRLVVEEHRRQRSRGGADHQAPAGRRIHRAHGLDDVDLRHGVGLGAAQDRGQLQGEKPRIVQGSDGDGRQGTESLRLVGAGGDRVADTRNGFEEGFSLRAAASRERSVHPVSLRAQAGRSRRGSMPVCRLAPLNGRAADHRIRYVNTWRHSIAGQRCLSLASVRPGGRWWRALGPHPSTALAARSTLRKRRGDRVPGGARPPSASTTPCQPWRAPETPRR